MGTGPDEAGGTALAGLATVAGSAGPWQHCKPELQRLMHVLRALGPDAEPALVSVLQGSDSKAQEAVASAVYDGDVTLTDGLRDTLLAFVGNPKLDQGLVALALARWPEDAAVAAAFAEALVGRNATPVMFEYLLPLQKPGERLAFLRTMVARSSRDVRTMAIGVMVGEGRVEAIRPMMAAAKGREPAEIARGLAAACEDHADANLRKTAVAIISEHLAQDDTYCQMNMVRALGEFGADATPALTAIKAIDPGDDTRLKEACEQAVAKIEKAKQKDKRE
jgi:hypothetical protein